MKKLVLSVLVAASAVVAQAGSDKTATKDASCCAMSNAQTKAECPMAKQGSDCCSASKTAKTACTKPILKSPKALG